MKLLGNRNWYLPSWLEWLPRINIEGAPRPEIDPEPIETDPRRELDLVG
jgi:RND superfamily putative drug exporter